MLSCSTYPSQDPHNIMDSLNSKSHASNITKLSEAPKCVRCSMMIYDATLVSYSDKFWHKSCFRCLLCQKEVNDACFTNGKEIYCSDDFNRLYRSQCAGCSSDLTSSEFVRRIFGSLYHELCFKCTLCDCSVQTGDRVYLRDDNKLICEKDYAKLHGQERHDSPLHPDNTRILDTSLVSLQQEDALNRAYISNPAPSVTQYKEFSEKIGLKTSVVQAWFREKRCRDQNVMANGEKLSTDPEKDFFSWLGKALSPNCVPPNVELTPDIIRNGEVLLSQLPRGDSHRTAMSYPCYADRQWAHCNSI
ncbi:LIM/homeobox protein Lhx3-like isoform X2 [Ostrea edulis]|uniref:LIM/homeobox protein Lhx3-like isoform X2 n=1 Tax=Ostrea edulis TaxID=37623 RepID=UPI0024AFA893|nr:LIM/homeobox protein Lhx3-like isoform X2 [Ostrea edulis]